MKKFFLGMILAVSLLFGTFIANAGTCEYDEDSTDSIGASLDSCLDGSKLVDASGDLSGAAFGQTLKTWSTNLSTIFAVLAVLSIVYGSILLVSSAGEEEKIKKGKDVIKWGTIGFLGIISAASIIALVVNMMYSI